ncbi:MAG: TetR family transcriptional regulator [Candidatus Delongbacteria bacterium]|nr:TetR family transcriptional regulator [Candidatus Delongbacteria bacterium]
MKQTPEKADATRRKLLDAAAEVFSRCGFAASRLEDIAREAGVTRGAIYWHFTNKQDLLRNLMQQRTARISEKLKAIYLSELPPVQKLRHLLQASLLNLETDSDYRSGMHLALSFGAAEEQIELMALRRHQHIQLIIDLLEKLLQECARAGALHPEVTPALAARALFAWFDGTAGLWLRTANHPVISLADQGNALVEIMLRGIINENE